MFHPQNNDVKEVIINTSREIFARFGFKKTTMDEIARATYKAKSSIYHYFASKEEIFQSVIEKESNTLKEEITKAINQENTPQQKLRAYVLTRMRVLNELVNFYIALKDDYLKHFGYIEKLREKYYKDEIKIIENILWEGNNEGIFFIDNVELTAHAILIALRGFEYPWIIEKKAPYYDTQIETALNSLLDILFYGIVKR